jgi:chromate reductase
VIMGASPGMTATARPNPTTPNTGLQQLSHLMRPGILLGRAHEKFDADGRLTDDSTIRFLQQLLTAFANWITE